MPVTLKGLVFGGDKKAETEYKHKTKLNNKKYYGQHSTPLKPNRCYAMALNFKKMEKILNDTFFSIKFFNEEGFEKVSDITGIDYDEIVFEYDCGNFLVGQSFSGRFYLFSDSDKPENEITFNSFIRLVEKAIA